MKRAFKIIILALKIAGAWIVYFLCSLVYYIAKILLHPKVYSVVMKTFGICCFIFAISALITWYASPPGAAAAFVFVGLCGILSKPIEAVKGEKK